MRGLDLIREKGEENDNMRIPGERKREQPASPSSSVRKNRLHHICIIQNRQQMCIPQTSTLALPIKLTHIIQLPTTSIHSLEQLIDLLVAHLLAQVRQDVAELAHADEARELLVEHLEAAAVLFRLAGVAEAARAVEDAGEIVEVDCEGDVSAEFSLKGVVCIDRARAFGLALRCLLSSTYNHRPSGSRDP